MFYLDAALMGLGLAMDAAAVSMANGLNEPKMKAGKMLIVAGAFGLFQGLMPLIGYAAGSVFSKWISDITPVLALVILSVLGGRMIAEGIKKKECDGTRALTWKLLAAQTLATSVDALTVGVVYVSSPLLSALACFGIIAAVTFAVSLLAVWMGKRAGTAFSDKAVIAGGVILIAIGLKIFIEYLINAL